MKKFLINPILQAFLVLTVIYWSIAMWFTSKTVIIFADGLSVSFSLSVAVLYGRRFFRGIGHEKPDVMDFLIAGIAGGWFVNAIDRSWRLIARVADSGMPHLIDSYMIGYLLVLLALCACLHLSVRHSATVEKEMPEYRPISTEAWWLITVALMMGVALGALALFIDLDWPFDWLKEFNLK